MKRKFLVGLAIGLLMFGFSSFSHATPVIPESFSAGLNTGYSVTGTSSVDGNVDWFVFMADGVNPVSFWFDRTVAAPDLIAGLYAGDTTGFDYAAAGADPWYSFWDAHSYNPALTFLEYHDDSHNDSLGRPFGDPHFTVLLQTGVYSVALSSLDAGGTYQFTANVSSIGSGPVPEPSTMLLLGVGLVGIAGATKRKLKK